MDNTVPFYIDRQNKQKQKNTWLIHIFKASKPLLFTPQETSTQRETTIYLSVDRQTG